MQTTVVTLNGVKKTDARNFSSFLMGRSAGAGVPEVADPEKASLGRDSQGRVIAQYRGRVLARAGYDKTTGMPTVEIDPVTPVKVHDKVVELFSRAYETWASATNTKLLKAIQAELEKELDPPKNGASEVVLEAVTRADIEELSLRDVIAAILPERISLVKFYRDAEGIRFVYQMAIPMKDLAPEVEGISPDTAEVIEIPLLRVRYANEKAVLASGDGISPAPVAYLLNMLDAAKKYNLTVCGPARLRKVSQGLTPDLADPTVMEALAHHLQNAQQPVELALTPDIQFALMPKTQSAYVYIDRKMIAQFKPGTDETPWIRPGYGWSPRTEFAQRVLVEAGRRLIAENTIETGPGKDWENSLEADLG